jgi:UDP:flavonoid glycosyltransferase YjiC (YdhE family)
VVRTLVTYISGHGFGHASRTIELLNALADRAPDVRIIVRSAVAPWLFARTARPTVVLEPVECDTGAVQIGSLHLDPDETVRRARAFMHGLPARVASEAALLRAHGATLVLADIPPLGIAAARAAGVPAVALSNFTWDWIYAAYPGTSDLSAEIGAIYASTDLALRLPLWGGFATFPRIVDLPFIARRSRRNRAEVRLAFDLPLDQPLALVSFGGYGVEGLDMAELAHVEPWGLLMTSTTPMGQRTLGEVGRTGSLIPLDEPGMYARGFLYEDIVHAMDVVVSKPGYGIIAECVANETALLYTTRGHFAEYDVLVAGLPRLLRAGFIDHDALFAGHWRPHLDALLAKPAPPERPRVDGADVAAALLLDMM